jgi:hypothetical protein
LTRNVVAPNLKRLGRAVGSVDRSSAFRRFFHIISPVFMGYYLLPEQLGGANTHITLTSVTLLFLGTAGCVEIARIALGIRLFGMRPYEGQRVSAYAQGALGLGVALFLIRDPKIVVPVFLGMAWIDPLAAFARKEKWPRSIVVAGYFVLFITVEAAMGVTQNWTWPFIAAVVATTSAMLVEGPKLTQIDDDLLMQVVPMTLLAVAATFLR